MSFSRVPNNFKKEGEGMQFKLLTKWHEKELVCCCTIKNKCSKEHGCEELEFTLDPYQDIQSCMKHDSYKRTGRAIKQVRHG